MSVAAYHNKKDTKLIEVLLNNMSLDSINKKNRVGETPLDYAFGSNKSPIRQEIIDLLRSKGGKANNHDPNGIKKKKCRRRSNINMVI